MEWNNNTISEMKTHSKEILQETQHNVPRGEQERSKRPHLSVNGVWTDHKDGGQAEGLLGT